jgi:pyruvate formate lyase activating enzyme
MERMNEAVKKALFWESLDHEHIQCHLCPRRCCLASGEVGVCRVRENIAGRLTASSYAQVSSISLDPIEKKPLFHFYPGRSILSLGAVGCNLACVFCQNWQISQDSVSTELLTPEQAVQLAQQYKGNLGIAFTYNEPLIWYEYILDTERLVHEAGMKTVLVTNGYIEEQPLYDLLPFIDAMNVDIKSMRDHFHRELTGGRAAPPRRTVEIAHQSCLVEVTNLVIPNWNDSDEEISELVDWLAGIDPTIPLHFSRYHPAYRMHEPPTPAATLQRAREIARQKLPYVYLGNIVSSGAEDTHCPSCKSTVIKRSGFNVDSVHLRNGKCAFCGNPIPVIGA